MRCLACYIALLAVLAQPVSGQDTATTVALVKMPYSGARNVAELSAVPDYLEEGGIVDVLRSDGARLLPITTVSLTADEERQYGEWQRLALANAHLGDIVRANARDGALTVGLLANCSSLMGVLGGLQHAGRTTQPLTVGLVFVDSHGDFNTPETTLSGMLGGMPVAVSAGLALHRVRRTSGLDPALPTEHIVMAAVRDLDPLEHELVEQSAIEMISVNDIRQRSDNLHRQMQRLSQSTDLIYIHIDMDVLDPAEVPGHSLNVPDGPTSAELAAALTEMFRYDKVAALGIASTPAGERDPDGVSRAAAYRLIRGAVKGVRQRGN
jgi:arginase